MPAAVISGASLKLDFIVVGGGKLAAVTVAPFEMSRQAAVLLGELTL